MQACKLDARLSGKAWPCLALDQTRGFALVPDLVHPTQVLLTPIVHLAGMESPELLSSPTPNYWAQAWASRGWMNHRVHSLSTWSGVGMAVNSRAGRTQDQLHIHIDCLRQSMRDVLDAKLQRVTESWSDFPARLVSGHVYRARWLARDMLGRTDPFRLTAADPQVRGRLAGWTLDAGPGAGAPADGRGGFRAPQSSIARPGRRRRGGRGAPRPPVQPAPGPTVHAGARREGAPARDGGGFGLVFRDVGRSRPSGLPDRELADAHAELCKGAPRRSPPGPEGAANEDRGGSGGVSEVGLRAARFRTC